MFGKTESAGRPRFLGDSGYIGGGDPLGREGKWEKGGTEKRGRNKEEAS